MLWCYFEALYHAFRVGHRPMCYLDGIKITVRVSYGPGEYGFARDLAHLYTYRDSHCTSESET